jgi:tetratricopeptide (TPR) repeat protein
MIGGGNAMRLRVVAIAVLLAVPGVPARPMAGAGSGMALLERYAHGDFDAVVRDMADITDFKPIYTDLKANAGSWIEAGGPADRDRRRLAAATFAMEAARIGANTDWKEVRMFMRLENIYWKPPALLLELGCALMRSTTSPTDSEHAWQMAALGVVGHAQDYEFLIGSPWDARANTKDEIKHLEHTIARFPKDRRLLLAQGIAAELRLYPRATNTGIKEAREIFGNLKEDANVGAEARMRLGAILVRARQAEAALPLLTAAADATPDPFVKYLANYFAGEALGQLGERERAEAAYRRALDAVPRAQSASFALSALLGLRGARAEAASLISQAIATPIVPDPWRAYGSGDDRFWPLRIAALRDKIASRAATRSPRR